MKSEGIGSIFYFLYELEKNLKEGEFAELSKNIERDKVDDYERYVSFRILFHSINQIINVGYWVSCYLIYTTFL
jgi:hypothetical protein